MSYVASIHIYPVKSLDGIAVSQATILPSGALAGDRSFAICDEAGEFVNAKRNSGVNFLRLSFDIKKRIAGLKIQDTEQEIFFHVDRERPAIESWLSNYFGFPVKLIENLLTGFPDDTACPGPSIISTATIAEVASWFPRVCVNEMRHRLRANIEIGDVPAFWEDRLFGAADEVVRFKIGQVIFEGIHPALPCLISTRNSTVKEAAPNLKNLLIAKQKEIMPELAKKGHFNHFSRLIVNTRVPHPTAGKIVHIGDEVQILSVSKSLFNTIPD
ncbi:MAG: MOSC N-terminal beta barrel domain-containing protein [Microcoleus sp. PH2017_10_PVI_O_A]|uniref:MOSC domain-containing protein n=1 Tax=unclassified Microcoleus TaxID=2642155 RepID=UPI001DC4B4AD|nr:MULTISPECIES: MOSC N-terminal beta barrel domain-containing protein [unclassified Microcoleus]TAE85281.1 MAG: MOSC domain-containing protein [Oscillatoriales cyanobacterium]MCC3406886.1 MOSC N-terminal beta barrel domain-containing protein [Microcoleus sp. PH2017_10_PVI_O_A]MCC3458756.1 MOSC N-terminal beta barrel domain-containing protein [Microcoleus sp. PH2017_11_PCY_U_A]MCC3476958.1 MOSC N-terminal beta barrel domain-containing protein [Microcoleus sp. PH2017_12_PCY_D_A]MCC3530908.1 MOS